MVLHQVSAFEFLEAVYYYEYCLLFPGAIGTDSHLELETGGVTAIRNEL